MSDNQFLPRKKPSVADRLKSSTSNVCNGESQQVSGSKCQISKYVDSLISRMENPDFFQRPSHFIQHAANVSDSAVPLCTNGDLFEKEISDNLKLATSNHASQENSPLLSGLKLFFPKPVKNSTTMIKQPSGIQYQIPVMTHPRSGPTSDVPLSAHAFLDKESVQECNYATDKISSCRKDAVITTGSKVLTGGLEGDASQLPIQAIELLIKLQLQKLKINSSRGRNEDKLLGSTLETNDSDEVILKCNDLLARGNNKDICIGNGLLAIRNDKNLRTCNGRLSAIGKDKDKPVGNKLSESRQNEYICFGGEDILEKRMEDISNEPLSITSEDNPHVESLQFLSLNGISLEYLQLYYDTRPENYNFAMNIMAYIELLNDSSWKATISYFDENVKRMLKHIWNVQKDRINDMIDNKRFHRDMILNLMVDFTKRTLNRGCNFDEFLNYCVKMCQLGVIGRKHDFREAPLKVIQHLCGKIKLFKFENFVQIMFEIVVEEYAQKLVRYKKV